VIVNLDHAALRVDTARDLAPRYWHGR